MGRRMNEKEKTDARRKTLGKKIAGGKWPERERERRRVREIERGREGREERGRERGRREKGEEKEGGGRTVDTGKARRMGYGTRHTPS